MAPSAAPRRSDDDAQAPAVTRPAPPTDRPTPPWSDVSTPGPHHDGGDTVVNGPTGDGGGPETPMDVIRRLDAAGVPAVTLALAVPFLSGWSPDSPMQPATVPLPPCPDDPEHWRRVLAPGVVPHHGPPSPSDNAPVPAPRQPAGTDRSDRAAGPPGGHRSREVAPAPLPTGRLQVSAGHAHPGSVRRSSVGRSASPPPPNTAPRGAMAFRRWSQNFVQALIEVLDGERPLRQLESWVHPDVYRALNRLDRRPGPDRRPGRRRAALRSLRIAHPVPDVAEVAAVYTRAGDRTQRCHVAALRIEVGGQGWLCTAVSLG